MKILSLTNMQRSRLKLTVSVMVVGIALILFGVGMIIWNTLLGQPQFNTDVWIFLGSGFASVVLAASYYTNKESSRPSQVINTNVSMEHLQPDFSDNEGESDDEEMPI